MVEYEEITPNIWKAEKEGDAIEGVLISKEADKGTYGSAAYGIENPEGRWLVWGCAVLDERMKYLEPGDQIKIEFKGIEKNKKDQDVKIFKVYKAKKEA